MRIPVMILATFALSGCAATGSAKLAACDGKHLRSANPHGSVLAPATEGQPPAPPAASGDSKPKTLSSVAPVEAFGSCA